MTACSLLGLIRVTISSEYKSTALRAAAEVSASRWRSSDPWKRIASTACWPLALMRVTTSSECSAAALRVAAEVFGESIGDEVAMEADRFDGLFPACADASNELVGDLRNRTARRG